MYSAAHVKGKHYTSVGSISYTPVNSCLDEGALRATCTHDCGRRRRRAHTLAVGVADFSEHPIIEIELRFDREANINRSEGEGEL